MPKRMRIVIVGGDSRENCYLVALLHGAPGLWVVGVARPDRRSLAGALGMGCDLLILALSSEPSDEVEIAREAQRGEPDMKVLAILAPSTPALTIRMLGLGIGGILFRPVDAETLLSAIGALRAQGGFFCPRTARVVASYFAARGQILRLLSRREAEVLDELASGCGVDRVAVNLGLSQATVRTHVRNITEKLGVNSVAGALAKYLNPPGRV